MGTEVLLMSDVESLGAAGDVVTVSDGYARNYLLPRKLAAPVTAAARAKLAKLQQERAAIRKAELDEARKLAARLAAVSCTVTAKTGEEGKLYGSVTTADIAATLAAQGIEIDRHKIVLEAPLKDLGVFDVKVKVHTDVEATVKVWIVEE
jgi:large subunit ribosomal protein L9